MNRCTGCFEAPVDNKRVRGRTGVYAVLEGRRAWAPLCCSSPSFGWRPRVRTSPDSRMRKAALIRIGELNVLSQFCMQLSTVIFFKVSRGDDIEAQHLRLPESPRGAT